MSEDNPCPHCGTERPHNVILVEDELEIDVTCESVYIVPTDDGDGFAFDHDEFRRIIDHFETCMETDMETDERTSLRECPECGGKGRRAWAVGHWHCPDCGLTYSDSGDTDVTQL